MPMTETNLEMIAEWFMSNYAYGHLDEIPDCFLITVIQQKNIAFLLTDIILTASMTKTDSIEELINCNQNMPIDVNLFHRAYLQIRAWMLVERLRRLGRLKISQDLLVKELATKVPAYGVVRNLDGTPFTSSIVETSTGVVNIVGEEINLIGS